MRGRSPERERERETLRGWGFCTPSPLLVVQGRPEGLKMTSLLFTPGLRALLHDTRHPSPNPGSHQGGIKDPTFFSLLLVSLFPPIFVATQSLATEEAWSISACSTAYWTEIYQRKVQICTGCRYHHICARSRPDRWHGHCRFVLPS